VVKLTIPGTPQGKARPRFSRTGHAYTPDATRRYEARVSVYGKYAMCNKDIFRGAVKVSILAAFLVPDSYSQKRRAACLQGSERPAKKTYAEFPSVTVYIEELE
jgi:Holliday junction resolvase RusA-like endonuclease